MTSKRLVLYISVSMAVLALNVSVNFFDPFKGGLGMYSTATGSSTTNLWAYTIVGIDALYTIFLVWFFRKLERK